MGNVNLVITKTLSATPEEVYRAWTDKEQVAKWYGPEGFTNEIHEWDLKEGGTYRMTMKAPNGDKHPLRGVFKTLNEPHKVVVTWQWDTPEGMAEETLVTVELKEVDGKTEMKMTHSGFPSEEVKNSHNEGWTSSFVRLEQLFG